MGMPVFLLHLIVLFDLRVNKSADSLVEMLTEFPEHAKEIAMAPASATSVIRQIMNELLETEEWFPYFQKMLDCLGPRILLHEATDEAPHLITRLVESCAEEYVLEIYNQIETLENINQEACSAYMLPFKKAYLTKKFKVIEHLYSKGFEYDVQVDQAVCGAEHPLSFATYFFVTDTESSVKFAKAYLNAARNRDDCGIRRNSRNGDPDCVFCETVLESIVKSGRCDIMELVLEQGANVNALSREGLSLLDISDGEMQTLLKNNGAHNGDRKDYLLHMSILGIKHQDPERLKYITELMELDPRYTQSINTETRVLHSYWTVNLLTEAVAFSDTAALQILLPMAKRRLYSSQMIIGLKRAIRYCIDDIFSVNCASIAKMLQLFVENGLSYLYEAEQKIFALQSAQDLIYYNRHAKLNEDDAVIDICYFMCKLFRLNPVDIYHKALVNISRPDWGETIPSRNLVKELFIPRGWKPRQLKRRKE